MRIQRILFLSAIILTTACNTTTPSPTELLAAQSRLSPEPSLPTSTTAPVFISIDDFEGSEMAWKAGNWEFRASIPDLNNVHRLAIIIYPAASGSATVDDIRLNCASSRALSKQANKKLRGLSKFDSPLIYSLTSCFSLGMPPRK